MVAPEVPAVRSGPVDHAPEAVWCGLILAAVGWDVWLLRSGHRLLTDAARTRTGWLIQAVLVAHFAGRLGRFDPFTAAAHRIPRRTT